MDRTVLKLTVFFAFLLIASLCVGRLLFLPWRANALDMTIVMYVRLPRVMAASLAGVALGLAGVALQNTFRNYLAGPGILGVTSGSAFGAVLAILLLPPNPAAIQLTAFVFGLLAMFLTYYLARLAGGGVLALILAGIVTSALFSACVGMVKYMADPYNKLPAMVYWLLGSFAGTRWGDLAPTVPPLLVGAVTLLLLRWVLNVLSLGDDEALALGVNVSLFRALAVVAATLATSASTSLAGMIAWVGVVSPHIARLLVGYDNRRLVPASALVGATLLLFCDDLARTLSAAELPLSVMTSFVGAPVLFAILVRRRACLAGS